MNRQVRFCETDHAGESTVLKAVVNLTNFRKTKFFNQQINEAFECGRVLQLTGFMNRKICYDMMSLNNCFVKDRNRFGGIQWRGV